jgi:iron complex transport system substrate-binding protein
MPVDFETVFQVAANTDFWRIFVSGAITYEDLKARDERIAEFKAWKDQKVIYCNTMEANYFSRATIQPHEILADFVHIFHPEILPQRKNKYFHLLK